MSIKTCRYRHFILPKGGITSYSFLLFFTKKTEIAPTQNIGKTFNMYNDDIHTNPIGGMCMYIQLLIAIVLKSQHHALWIQRSQAQWCVTAAYMKLF